MDGLVREELRREGLPVEEMKARRYLDARYVGQSFELTIDYPASTPTDLRRSISSSFYRAHLQRFGYADRNEPVEVVNLRLTLELEVAKPTLPPVPATSEDAMPARIGEAPVVFQDGSLITSLYQPGRPRQGP